MYLVDYFSMGMVGLGLFGVMALPTDNFASVKNSEFEIAPIADTTKYLNISDIGTANILEPTENLSRVKVYTIADIDSETGLEEWTAPFNISRDYVYYLAGYDYDNRPVWMAEPGKWDLVKIVRGGESYTKAFEKYIRQMALRFVKSWRNSSLHDETVENCMVLVDLGQLPLTQVLSVDALAFFLRMNYQFRELISKTFGYVMAINTNAVAATVLNAIRPVLGEVFDRIEVFGTNKARWQPELLKRVPRTSVPTWYGGEKSFQPVVVYG